MRGLVTRSIRSGKITGVCVALSLVLGISAERAAALAERPQDSVRNFYAILLTMMKDGQNLGQSGRYAKISPVVKEVFDIPLMTRLAIGPSWVALSPAQQEHLTEAFQHYIAATYADRFDSYSGEDLQVTGQRPYSADVIVQSRIVKSNGQATDIDYLMRQHQGSWQISDVYLDGTISQLAMQRAEFQSILRRDGVDGLIMALSHKVDLLTRSAPRPS